MDITRSTVKELLCHSSLYPAGTRDYLRAALKELEQIKELEEHKHLAHKLGDSVVEWRSGISGKVTDRNADKKYTVEWSDGSVTRNLPEERIVSERLASIMTHRPAIQVEAKDFALGDPIMVRCCCEPRPAEFIEYKNDKEGILVRCTDGTYVQAPYEYFTRPEWHRRSAEMSFTPNVRT